MSGLIREALRLYMQEAEWRRIQRYGQRRAREQGHRPRRRGAAGGRLPGRRLPGMSKEDAPMNQNTDYTPVALYARVSSDRQDVDLVTIVVFGEDEAPPLLGAYTLERILSPSRASQLPQRAIGALCGD